MKLAVIYMLLGVKMRQLLLNVYVHAIRIEPGAGTSTQELLSLGGRLTLFQVLVR